MNDLLQRATALRHVFAEHEVAFAPVAEATVACCEDLVRSGDPRLALELVRLAINCPSTSACPMPLILRLHVAEARSLIASGDYRTGLDHCDEIRARFGRDLETAPTERAILTITRGCCLWQLNRVEEAVEVLHALRGELLAGP